MTTDRYVALSDTHGCGRVQDTRNGAIVMAGLHPVTARQLAALMSAKDAGKKPEQGLALQGRKLQTVADTTQRPQG